MPPAPSTSAAIPRDFPDWLSPMVVKEVRQGLRGRVFLALFLLLHLGLLFWCLGTAAEGNAAQTDSDWFFWGLLATGLAVIVARGIGALHAERQGNTLELLQITRLSAWKIAAGKWVALLVQMALFLSSLLPYGMLRYYLGTLDADRDGRQLIFLVGIGAVFAALAVYLSCLKRWLAWAVGGGVLALWVFGIEEFQYQGSWLLLGELAFQGGVVVAILLALAASTFTSASENPAPLKRLLGWLLFLPTVVVLGFGLVSDGNNEVGFPILIAFFATALISADALTAPGATTPFALRGFSRRGGWGKLLALVFAPNRASGVVYTVLSWAFVTGALLLVMLILQNGTKKELLHAVLSMSSLLSLLLLANGLAYLAPRRWRQPNQQECWVYIGDRSRFVFWIFLLIGIGVSGIFTATNTGISENTWRNISLISPVGVFAETWSFPLKRPFPPLLATGIHWLLAVSLLALPIFREFKNLRRLLRGERLDSQS